MYVWHSSTVMFSDMSDLKNEFETFILVTKVPQNRNYNKLQIHFRIETIHVSHSFIRPLPTILLKILNPTLD